MRSSVGKDEEELQHSYIAGGDVQWYISNGTKWKMFWQFIEKLNIQLPCNPAILLLDIYPRKMKVNSTQRLLHKYSQQLYFNGPKLETSQVITIRGMDKTIAYIHTIGY